MVKLYGLLGKTLKHSFSKKYFDKKFIDENIANTAFELFELEVIEHLPQLLQQHHNIAGLCITIPYKEVVLPYLHQQNTIVKSIGACNCITFKNGQLTGHNTDVIGFKNSLQPLLQQQHNQALVLGAGGAAKAVIYALQMLGINYTQVVRQNKTEQQLYYNQLNKDIIAAHPLIINTTPLGTYPNINELPSIPYEDITDSHLLYDLVYNPTTTAFMQQGIKVGAKVSNGYEMLRLQAEENWKLWNE